jgi:hypothetical protein
MAVLNTLRIQIESELHQPVPEPVRELAAQLAARAGSATVAVLYYGSTLRSDALDGMLDFYVLLDRVGAWPGSRLAAMANRLLPPNVGYVEGRYAGVALRAKYALISMAQFEERVAGRSLDTTLWARFCQPCRCVWARSTTDAMRVAEAVGMAVVTAARWSAALGPEVAQPAEFWMALFARTYASELRVEGGQRAGSIVATDAPRYSRLLPEAWQVAGMTFETGADGSLRPGLVPAERARQQRQWRLRQRLGKPLNAIRLMKAAFTFDGAMDYVAWKIERHTGTRIEVRPWQRRFPLLAAPGLYFSLRRRGILR